MAYITPEGYTFNSKSQYDDYMANINNYSTGTNTSGEKQIKWYDTPNMLNAGATMMFTGLASFFSTWSSSKIYDLYAEQEKLYLENAEEQARRLQIKGEFALADLRTRHALAEGKNELAVAGAGAGAISGSYLDKLLSNKKYSTRDEAAKSYEVLWAVENAKREGLINAYSVAGAAYSKAIQQRNSAISGLFTGLQKGISSLLADMRQEDSIQTTDYKTKSDREQERRRNNAYYNNAETEKISKLLVSKEVTMGASLLNLDNPLNIETSEIEEEIREQTKYNILDFNEELFKN